MSRRSSGWFDLTREYSEGDWMDALEGDWVDVASYVSKLEGCVEFSNNPGIIPEKDWNAAFEAIRSLAATASARQYYNSCFIGRPECEPPEMPVEIRSIAIQRDKKEYAWMENFIEKSSNCQFVTRTEKQKAVKSWSNLREKIFGQE